VNASLEQLFERYCRRGDVAALADAFDRTAPEILRVAMHLARDPIDAEELLQETFLAAIRRADRFDAARPLVPWLLGILTNLARNARRKRARRPNAARLAMPTEGAEDGATEGQEVRNAVASAVDRIPEPYRAVLVLHLQHGLSPVQIAHALNLPPATVRSQLQRGLQQLRKRLPRSVAPRVLVALPLTGGLSGIRETVLAEGAALAVAAPTAAALVLGGLIVTKKTLVASAALLCLVLATGGAYLALDGASDDGRAEPVPVDLTAAPTRPEKPLEDGPTLSAAGSAPLTSVSEATAAAPDVPTKPKRVPLDKPIPAGKGSVAGTLHFEDGTPVKGVKVALWGSSPVEDVTDEEGAFHLHGDWAADRTLYIKGEQKYDAVLLKHVAMKADELVRVAFTIKRGHELKGGVRSAADDTPIVNTLVVLRRPGSRSNDDVQAGYASHRTDENGRFHFRYLPAASYTVELGEPGFEAWLGRVEIGAETPDADYRLKRSRPFQVVFEGLAAEAEGTVVSWMFQRMDPGAPHYSPDGKSKLGPGGTLRLDAPPAGKWQLLLFRSKFTDRVERHLEVGESQDGPLVIPREITARVEGVLRNFRGKPLADTRIQIGRSVGLRTNAEGRFVIARSPLGKQSVWAMFGTGWVTLPGVDVASAGTIQLELTMPGSATLKGRVLKKRTQHGNGTLRTLDSGRPQVAMAVPDSHGNFEIPHLAAGRYEFVWTQSGAEPVRHKVDLRAGSTLDLGDIASVALPRVPVEVSVPRGATRPLLLKMKYVMPAGGGNRSVHYAGGIRLDAEGRGAITTVHAGTWRLQFSAAPFADVEVDVTVVEGENETLTISLEHP